MKAFLSFFAGVFVLIGALSVPTMILAVPAFAQAPLDTQVYFVLGTLIRTAMFAMLAALAFSAATRLFERQHPAAGGAFLGGLVCALVICGIFYAISSMHLGLSLAAAYAVQFLPVCLVGGFAAAFLPPARTK
jgi:hypothetical protein